MVFSVFFFQAEDGRRDLVRSRGLGDVYKRQAQRELSELRQRGRLANGGIALLTLCSVLIGLTIIVLFVGETTGFQISRWAVGGFLSGVVCFLLALLCFLLETYISTRLLNFHIPVSYTHLRAHETVLDLVCRLLLEKNNPLST
mgnify:CR=1 FL=1